MVKKVSKSKSRKSEKVETEKVLNRISRINGQLRGIRKMVEEKKECMDIVTQISAIREAVAMLGIELLRNDFVCKWKGNRGRIDEKYMRNLFKMK